MVDKENVHFVYMYIYIEVPITFVSMGYEQRNWPTCERNYWRQLKIYKKQKKIFRKIAEKKIKRLIEWKCVTVFVCFSTWTWICLIYEIWKSFTEWLCVKAWSVHMILKGVWKRNIEKKMVHEMLKMLLLQVRSIKVLSKNRFCS